MPTSMFRLLTGQETPLYIWGAFILETKKTSQFYALTKETLRDGIWESAEICDDVVELMPKLKIP